jgi:hypothetical protein
MPSPISKRLRSSHSNPGLATVMYDLAELMSLSIKKLIKQEHRESLDGIQHNADPAVLADNAD